MQNTAVKAALISLLSIMLVNVAANADLCVLKNGDYTLSSKYTLKTYPTTGYTATGGFSSGALETATPCTTADGNADNIVPLSFEVGADIILDVVYQQDPVNQYKIAFFDSIMYYDTTNMTNSAGADIVCNDDPADFFKDTSFLPLNCGAGLANDGTTPVVISEGVQVSGNSWPAEPANFVLDRVKFANKYTAGTDLYTIDFEKDNVGHTITVPTDVGVIAPATGDTCGVFSEPGGWAECAANSITKQTIKTSKITVTAPSCYIGPPTITSAVTCVGDSTACAADSSSTTGAISFTYGLPNCYTTTDCSGSGSTTGTCTGYTTAAGGAVIIKDSTGADTAQESDGTYTESIANTGTKVPISFVARGVGKGSFSGCSPSSSCTAGGTTVTATMSTACSCGARPTIAPTNINQITSSTYVKNSDIKIDFTIADTDKASGASFSTDITEIKLYYRNVDNDTVAAQEVSISPSTISSTGKLTVTIDKAYVDSDVSIFLGIVIKDVQNLTGVYPSNFDVNTTTKIFTKATAAEIPGENIIEATSFAFSSEPYPNQFPFVAAGDANNMLQINFGVNAPSYVTMRIYSMDGRLVRQIDDSTNPIGSCLDGVDCNRCNYTSGCQWDGTDYRGGNSVVGNGMYIVNIHAVATGDLFTGAAIDYTKGIVVMK